MKPLIPTVSEDYGQVMARGVGNFCMKTPRESHSKILKYFLTKLIISIFLPGKTKGRLILIKKLIDLFPFSIIRIEIDSYLADYYPEIDAVLLVGTERFPLAEESLKRSVSGLALKVIELGLHHITPGCNLMENLKRLRLLHKPPHHNSTTCHLNRLPVIRFIYNLSPAFHIIPPFIIPGGNIAHYFDIFGFAEPVFVGTRVYLSKCSLQRSRALHYGELEGIILFFVDAV